MIWITFVVSVSLDTWDFVLSPMFSMTSWIQGGYIGLGNGWSGLPRARSQQGKVHQWRTQITRPVLYLNHSASEWKQTTETVAFILWTASSTWTLQSVSTTLMQQWIKNVAPDATIPDICYFYSFDSAVSDVCNFEICSFKQTENLTTSLIANAKHLKEYDAAWCFGQVLNCLKHHAVHELYKMMAELIYWVQGFFHAWRY